MASEDARAAVTATPTAAADTAGTGPVPKPAVAKRRAGVPVWRTGKPDAVLAAAVDVARDAITTIAQPGEIGAHIGARSEGDRLVTHLFESRLPGYVGWQWFAVITRNSRSKVVTVSELGLLPSEDSILAPEWVPWAERVRPEDQAAGEEAEEAVAVAVAGDADESEAYDDADETEADADDPDDASVTEAD